MLTAPAQGAAFHESYMIAQNQPVVGASTATGSKISNHASPASINQRAAFSSTLRKDVSIWPSS
jgi:hypothetical protein